MDTLGAFLDDWEAQHGHLTPEELARAHDEMKLLPPRGRHPPLQAG
jgi:hypothetical protein